MKKHIIIVAGGKGLRMGGDIPKQFVPIGGKPVLMRTLEAFYTYDPAMQLILVLPPVGTLSAGWITERSKQKKYTVSPMAFRSKTDILFGM